MHFPLRFWRSSLLSLLINSTLAAAAPALLEVKTDLGAVRGTVRNGVLEFRGIPFAASPSGERRWTPPAPATPWEGVRDASEFGPGCPQVARYGLTDGSDVEDCLSINVSLPKDTKPKAKLPVIAWIHGGAFWGGASNLYRLDALTQRGVIVVSFNYRLGAFGFMPHPSFDAKDNGAYGLEDQRAALQWVQRNIAAFGGDPSNITVAGESAGAGSICEHLAHPEHTEGLFQKAMLLSAGCLHDLPTVSKLQALGTTVAESVGCKDPATALSCLRKASLQSLLDASAKAAGSAVLAFAPSNGSEATPRSFAEAIQTGKILKVPVLMGGTRDELRLYVGYSQQAGEKVTAENFTEFLRKTYESSDKEKAQKNLEKITQEYPVKGVTDLPAYFGSIESDYHPHVGINNCLYLHSAEKYSKYAKVYAFEFADPDALNLGVSIPAQPDPGMALGAVHSSELTYFFPNMSNTSRIDAPNLTPPAQALADQMQSFWVSFAKKGVPSSAKAPAWPLYKGGSTVMLQYPGKVGPYDASRQHHCEFWKTLYPEKLGS